MPTASNPPRWQASRPRLNPRRSSAVRLEKRPIAGELRTQGWIPDRVETEGRPRAALAAQELPAAGWAPNDPWMIYRTVRLIFGR